MSVRLSDTELGPNSVRCLDSYFHVEQANAGFLAVFFQRVECALASMIENRREAVFGVGTEWSITAKVRDLAGELYGLPLASPRRLGRVLRELVPVMYSRAGFPGSYTPGGCPNFFVQRFCGHGVCIKF